MKQILLLLVFISRASITWAGGSMEWLPVQTGVFHNSPELCAKNNSCSLKSFTLIPRRFIAHAPDGLSYGTSTIASYETETVADLEKYVIVQFLQGCMFESKINNGKTEKTNYWGALLHFNNGVNYKFKNWVLDSTGSDPASYNFDEKKERHFQYLWNKVQGSYSTKTYQDYGIEKPVFPSLYVRDIGTTVFYAETNMFDPSQRVDKAINSSVRFKTCIYFSDKVPLVTNDTGVKMEDAIACLDWDRNYVYNHETSKYESKGQEIDSYCLK